MAIESLQALVTASENRDICDVIIESDCVDRGVTQAESLEKMRGLYAAIRRAQRGYDPKLRSASGMVGGDGEKMRAYVQRGKTICGDYIGGVIAQALEMGESNACMKCIVAAPTAGSCGVLPAVLLPYQQREGLSDEAMVRAMYVAGAIGQVVAAKASIAGAAGGCGAALAGVLRADLRRGIDTVLDLCGFDALVPGCSLVVTGEGRVDGQTAKYGKVPAGVLARCGDVPCAVLTGCVGPEAERLLAMGNCMIFPIADRPMTLEYAMEHAEALAASAADRLFWALGAFR